MLEVKFGDDPLLVTHLETQITELFYFGKCLKGICLVGLLIVLGRSLLCSGLFIVIFLRQLKECMTQYIPGTQLLLKFFIWFSLLPKQIFLKFIFREN